MEYDSTCNQAKPFIVQAIHITQNRRATLGERRDFRDTQAEARDFPFISIIYPVHFALERVRCLALCSVCYYISQSPKNLTALLTDNYQKRQTFTTQTLRHQEHDLSTSMQTLHKQPCNVSFPTSDPAFFPKNLRFLYTLKLQ